MTGARTLLQMAGANPSPARLGEAALVIIDAQNEYVTGRLPLEGVAAALDNIAALLKAARGADKALITDVSIFDLFEGPGVGDGKKSVAIRVTLQPTDKTLTDEEIEKVGAAVVGAVTKATGGSLRG